MAHKALFDKHKIAHPDNMRLYREKERDKHTVQQPCLRQTPNGGRRMAIKISQKISHLVAISIQFHLETQRVDLR